MISDGEERSGPATALWDGVHSLYLKQLYYFHAVANVGSIARAAKQLGISQSTVSEQLKSLEHYLGQPLLERRPNGMRLNTRGRRAYEHTKLMFQSLHRLFQELGPERAQRRWVLEVGLCPTISRTFAVRRFVPLLRLDDVHPRIQQGSYEEIMEGLLAGRLDLVLSEIRPPDFDEDRVGVKVLLDSPLVFVARADLAEQAGPFPEALGDLPFLHYTRASHYRWQIDAFFAEHGLSPKTLGEVDDVMLMAAGALEGLFCAVVPESSVALPLKDGRLRALGELTQGHSRIYAQFRSAKTPEVVQRAVEALQSAQ